MVDYEYQELFLKDSIDKQIHIVSDEYIIFKNGMKKPLIDITNKELHQEKFELTESLCSESELTFGSCEASMIKFTVSNTFLPMKDKWLTVTIKVKTGIDVYDTFQIGRYKVYSDELSADRTCRDITAYDAMYDIVNSDVIDWYNSVFPLIQEQEIQIDEEGNEIITVKNKYQSVTMKQFRESFIQYFGLEDSEIDGLINDDMIVEKTIEVEGEEEENSEAERKSVLKESSLSGATVIQAICEINGCFGHIGRDDKFHYIYLEQDIQGLYPSNELFPDHAPDYLPQSKTGHLYPQNPKSTNIGKSFYITANCENYRVKSIDKLQIRTEENDIGSIVGEGENAYIIEDNFLVYGKNAEDLEKICSNIYDKIQNIIYRPFSADCKGNPCLEVGDSIRMSTKYELIETYILERTLTGIQSLRDAFSSKGEEYRTKNVNSVSKSIIQLKGKTNTLIRNVGETRLEIKDTEKKLQSTITQTASEIRTEVQDVDNKLSLRIIQTAESLKSEVSRATQEEGNLSTRIVQNAESISAEVLRATKAEEDLSASITINAENISTKVSKNNVISEINQTAEKITIKASKIDLKGLVEAEEFLSKYATIDTLNVTKAKIDEAIIKKATIESLEATNARVENLELDHVSIFDLNTTNASINNLWIDKASINSVSVLEGRINTLQTSKLSADEFNAETISAMGIIVKSANIEGVLNANQIGTGTGEFTPQWVMGWFFTGKPQLNVKKENGVVVDVSLSGGISQRNMLIGTYEINED